MLSGVEVAGRGLGTKRASPSTEFSGKLGRHSPELTLGSWLGHQPDCVLNSGCWPSLSNADCVLNCRCWPSLSNTDCVLNCRCWPSLSNADCVLSSGCWPSLSNADCSPWVYRLCLSTSGSQNTPSTTFLCSDSKLPICSGRRGLKGPLGPSSEHGQGESGVINNLELTYSGVLSSGYEDDKTAQPLALAACSALILRD